MFDFYLWYAESYIQISFLGNLRKQWLLFLKKITLLPISQWINLVNFEVTTKKR